MGNLELVSKKITDDYVEHKYSNGDIVRFVPTDDNIDEPNGKLINWLCNEKTTALCIPEGITNIEYGAFTLFETKDGEWDFLLSNLKKITLPSTLTNIEEGAFALLDLKEVVIPKNSQVVKIENNALLSKDGKKFIHKLGEKEYCYQVPYGVEEVCAESFAAYSMNVELPDTVTKISQNAFAGHSGTVKIPTSVNCIEKNAFSKNSKLLVNKKSYARKWAKKNKIKFEIVK